MVVEVERMMKYSTYIWYLVGPLESESPASCKTPATSIDSIHQNNQPRRNKKSWKKIKLQTNCIMFPWPRYAKSRAKRGRLGTKS